jgi:OOP family OmpA-OmpF porin
MKRTIALITGCLLSLATWAAHAQATTSGMQLTMDRGFYVGLGGGTTHSSNSNQGCLGACDTRDTGWSVFAGYQLNKWFSGEVAYSDFGEHTISGTLFGIPVTERRKTKAFEAVGIGSLPISDTFSVYLKAGVFRYDNDTTTSGALVQTSSNKGAEFTLGVGAQYLFNRNFGARFEWQRYNDISGGQSGSPKEDITVWRLSGRYKF